MTGKLLTGIIDDEIYGFVDNEAILPEEQKGCRRKSKGTGDQLYIDKMPLQEVKQRKKNLVMRYIDYHKACDMGPHYWVIDSLNMIDMATNVLNFFGEMMKSWRVELTYGSETPGEVLSPLLFVIALIPLTYILRTANPGYEFRTGENINHLLFMDILKLYSKSEKALDSLI